MDVRVAYVKFEGVLNLFNSRNLVTRICVIPDYARKLALELEQQLFSFPKVCFVYVH